MQDSPELKDTRRRGRPAIYGRPMTPAETKRHQRYGFSPSMWENLLRGQEGKCKICLAETDRLVLDHDHADGSFRGAICMDCNRGLGGFKDSENSLARAISYLRGTI